MSAAGRAKPLIFVMAVHLDSGSRGMTLIADGEPKVFAESAAVGVVDGPCHSARGKQINPPLVSVPEGGQAWHRCPCWCVQRYLALPKASRRGPVATMAACTEVVGPGRAAQGPCSGARARCATMALALYVWCRHGWFGKGQGAPCA